MGKRRRKMNNPKFVKKHAKAIQTYKKLRAANKGVELPAEDSLEQTVEEIVEEIKETFKNQKLSQML